MPGRVTSRRLARRWKEFQNECRRAFARFALLSWRIGALAFSQLAPGKMNEEEVLAWIKDLFSSSQEIWSKCAGETQWANIFLIFGTNRYEIKNDVTKMGEPGLAHEPAEHK